jgi:hypothetical protein
VSPSETSLLSFVLALTATSKPKLGRSTSCAVSSPSKPMLRTEPRFCTALVAAPADGGIGASMSASFVRLW